MTTSKITLVHMFTKSRKYWHIWNLFFFFFFPSTKDKTHPKYVFSIFPPNIYIFFRIVCHLIWCKISWHMYFPGCSLEILFWKLASFQPLTVARHLNDWSYISVTASSLSFFRALQWKSSVSVNLFLFFLSICSKTSSINNLIWYRYFNIFPIIKDYHLKSLTQFFLSILRYK